MITNIGPRRALHHARSITKHDDAERHRPATISEATLSSRLRAAAGHLCRLSTQVQLSFISDGAASAHSGRRRLVGCELIVVTGEVDWIAPWCRDASRS